MATEMESRYQTQCPDPSEASQGETFDGSSARGGVVSSVFRALASLKLSVALFAFAIFIILVGTLAQVHQDMWEVMAVYFRSWVTWVEVTVFFPPTWFPGLHDRPFSMNVLVAVAAVVAAGLGSIPCFVRYRSHPMWLFAAYGILVFGVATAAQALVRGNFVFLGGAAIGTMLALNLLAAHLVRFTVQVSGWRLAFGSLVILLGVVLTWLVIAAGHNPEGLQGQPAFSWSTLWTFCKVGLLLLWLGMVAGITLLVQRGGYRRIEVALLGGGTVLVALLTGWVWFGGESAYLGDAGMRIMWQLIQAQFVALVLLFGCILTFRRRGGMVLLHGGLALMMLGEWFVSWYAVEERLMIQEGQATNYAVDIRETELAVVDPTYSDTEDDVVVIPQSLFEGAHERRETIRHDDLPFHVQIVDYMPNSALVDPEPGITNPATAGNGRHVIAQPRRGRGGATVGAVDMASAYVRFLDRDTGESLGVYLLSQFLSEQQMPELVQVGDRTYEVALRFKRTYKPYTMYLHRLLKDDYIGTATPRDYASYIHLMDPERNVDRDNVRIWMNNPLRYAGETFYQSSYHRDPRTGIGTTTLQVVTNTGWMIPYVACMLVATGMLAHFWSALMRFFRRRWDTAGGKSKGGTGCRKEARETEVRPRRENLSERFSGILAPGLIALVCVAWVVSLALPRATPTDDFDLVGFGKLPVIYEGRVKPVDTVARNALQKISDYQTFRDRDGRRHAAVEWFLDMVANPQRGEHHRVFRIYTPEVLQTLGLERRRGYHYSLAEIRGDGNEVRDTLADFEQQVQQARGIDAEELSFYERKLLETDRRFRTYLMYAAAFQPMEMPPLPSPEEIREDREAAMQRIFRMLAAVSESEEMLENMHAPLLVPDLREAFEVENEDADEVADGETTWMPYATAVNRGFLRHRILDEPLNPALERLHAMFVAYARNDPRTFNREMAAYRELLDQHQPTPVNPRKVNFESYFNHVAPLFYCILLYGFAALLSAASWFGWSKPLNRSAFAVLLIGFALHTFGVIARIYISGRPPVTNLYSSAVFIGWSCVAFGLILERLYRLGIGNLVGGICGAATLVVAAFLGMRGDTFTVLQAVLDTQFWLTAHVVTIVIGYAATFVAGLVGIVYIALGFFTTRLNQDFSKSLIRIIYGTVCFALFFSFIGTVLGGLWADDSWGRFWGWDPKENGALILVLWGALMLHARWDGMVRDRGFAVLAVAGNIVTSWSWFGVNELGVGLHSYGFTEGVLRYLALFVLGHLTVIAIGCLPLRQWLSFRSRGEAVA